MTRLVPILALTLLIAACGDDDAATTTVDASSTTMAAGSSTTAATTTTATTSAPFAGATDCLDIWPEAAVQAVAGDAYTFFAANQDQSACTYMSIPNGIALGWRTENAEGFGMSRTGASRVSGVEDVAGVCDGAFVTVIQDTVLVMEAYSQAQGRAFTATLSGIPTTDARTWAEALLASAC